MAAVNGLHRSGRRDDAFELAQELYTNFPNSPYAAEALLVSAHLLHYDYFSTETALKRLYTVLSLYRQSPAVTRTYKLLADIYLSPGVNHNLCSRLSFPETIQAANY